MLHQYPSSHLKWGTTSTQTSLCLTNTLKKWPSLIAKLQLCCKMSKKHHLNRSCPHSELTVQCVGNFQKQSSFISFYFHVYTDNVFLNSTYSMATIYDFNNILDLKLIILRVESDCVATILLLVDRLVLYLYYLILIGKHLKALPLQSHNNTHSLRTTSEI